MAYLLEPAIELVCVGRCRVKKTDTLIPVRLIRLIVATTCFILNSATIRQGHQLLIITATNEFITRPIARALGIDELLACEGEIVDGLYTGEPTGIPSYHAGKVTRLETWSAEMGTSMTGAYFYSDSHNDLPLLELVDNPVAVDPDDKLRARAQVAGWPIISLRA